MNAAPKTPNIIWFCLYKVLKQATLIHSDQNHQGDYILEVEATDNCLWKDGNFLHVKCSGEGVSTYI